MAANENKETKGEVAPDNVKDFNIGEAVGRSALQNENIVSFIKTIADKLMSDNLLSTLDKLYGNYDVDLHIKTKARIDPIKEIEMKVALQQGLIQMEAMEKMHVQKNMEKYIEGLSKTGTELNQVAKQVLDEHIAKQVLKPKKRGRKPKKGDKK